MNRQATLLAVLLAAVAAPGAARAQIPRSEYQERRAALLRQLGDGAVVAFGAREPVEDYLAFYQTPSFNFLTGVLEPDAALVVVKRGGQATTTIFVPPRDPSREVWTGSRLGVEGARERTGMDARPTDELRAMLDSLATARVPLFVVGDFPGGETGAEGGESPLTPDQQLVLALQRRHPGLAVKAIDGRVTQLRGRKSAAELAMIRTAAGITVLAQREAMRALEPRMNEFEIQALIEYTFRRNGAERPSFASIVGSGPNATTLHYNADDRFIDAGDLVVMDIGASYRGYAADVTRTVPASGTYSPGQREIYRIVRDAQAAGERQARLGAPAQSMSDSATAVLAAGLARLGLVESPDATYECRFGARIARCPQYTLYYMHGLGHGIGLEVHDPDQYYYTGRIAPGSAFTIEPGIYVRADVLDVLPDTPANHALAARLRPAVTRYANVGVRIEDDYVATESGVEWISRAPREMDEIEALMRTPWSGPAPRDSALVDSYRRSRQVTP